MVLTASVALSAAGCGKDVAKNNMTDKNTEKISNKYYIGERPLFNKSNLEIDKTIFGEGESPLKESDNIRLKASSGSILCGMQRT